MFTLTIYFIALNVSVEFVLIYRPHPVAQERFTAIYCSSSQGNSWDMVAQWGKLVMLADGW